MDDDFGFVRLMMISTCEIPTKPPKRTMLMTTTLVQMNEIENVPGVKENEIQQLRWERNQKSHESLLGINDDEWKDEFWIGPTIVAAEMRPMVKLDW